MNLFAKLCRSILTALMGLCHVFRSEQNMRIHALAAIGVVIAGFCFGLATWEWVAVVICIGLVVAAECFNTSLERLADRVSTERHPLVKNAKDCASAAVLALSLAAAIVGGLIFVPKIGAALGW